MASDLILGSRIRFRNRKSEDRMNESSSLIANSSTCQFDNEVHDEHFGSPPSAPVELNKQKFFRKVLRVPLNAQAVA